MAKNPYFLDNTSEQRLIEDITRETISAMGRKIYYIPREFSNKDYLYGEDTVSRFNRSYELVAYVNNVTGFDGQGDLITKFGIDLKDRIELVLSKKTFQDTITRVNTDLTRPKEGDLIYFDDSDTLFEINFVEHENPFYPLGKLYTYVLTCETFVFSQEDFNTNQSFIDDTDEDYGKTAAELTMTNNGVNYIVGETVYQIIGNGLAGPTEVTLANKDASGIVHKWKSSTGVLIIGDQTGGFSFEAGEYIYGVSSGATGSISQVTDDDLIIPFDTIENTSSKDSLDLEKEKEEINIFNFDETDPFSEGNY